MCCKLFYIWHFSFWGNFPSKKWFLPSNFNDYRGESSSPLSNRPTDHELPPSPIIIHQIDFGLPGKKCICQHFVFIFPKKKWKNIEISIIQIDIYISVLSCFSVMETWSWIIFSFLLCSTYSLTIWFSFKGTKTVKRDCCRLDQCIIDNFFLVY